jgi:hypothetical protein
VRRSLIVSVVVLALQGCFLFGSTTSPSQQSANTQAQLQANLEQQRVQAQAGDPQAQVMYAATLLGVVSSPDAKAAYGEVDWDAMVAEAEGMLEQQAASPDEATALQAVSLRAELQAATGRGAEALATWQAAHDTRPSFTTAVGLLLISQATGVALADPVGFCEQNRSLAAGDMQLYQFMQACYGVNPAGSMQDALPWASEADLALYAQVDAQVQAEAAARQAEWEAQREAERAENQRRMDEAAAASAASSSASSGGSSAPAGPSVVSVTLKNNCRETVKLFFGDKPKYGSGTYSSLSANTLTSKSFSPGDMIWIVDDSQNGISSTSVSAGMSRVEITESCTGLTAR